MAGQTTLFDRPQLWIIAGPNGAGKSTLVSRRLAGRVPVVNPDDIAQALPRLANGILDEFEAGRRSIVYRERLLRDGVSFAIETTLSGMSALRLMKAAVKMGYKVNLVYVGISNVTLSRLRVRERVALGGHDVPDEAILRRYPDTMKKLALALNIAHRSYVLDNSGRHRRLLLKLEGNIVKQVAFKWPAWATDAIPSHMRDRS